MADEKEDKRLPSFRTDKPKKSKHFVDKTDPRVEETIKNKLSGMTLNEASVIAGFKDGYMDHKSANADYIRAEVARRMVEARAKAQIHTDVITGSLVEIMMASPADILPDHPVLQKAKENGVAHLIKKISIIPIRVGTRSRKNKNGSVTESPVIREKIDLEMYSRLDAIGQLRDNYGMKQEPRANSFEETKRQEVEREIQGIMAAEGCDEPTAAKMLLENIGDAPQLRVVIEKILRKFKAQPEAKQESVH